MLTSCEVSKNMCILKMLLNIFIVNAIMNRNTIMKERKTWESISPTWDSINNKIMIIIVINNNIPVAWVMRWANRRYWMEHNFAAKSIMSCLTIQFNNDVTVIINKHLFHFFCCLFVIYFTISVWHNVDRNCFQDSVHVPMRCQYFKKEWRKKEWLIIPFKVV